MQIRTLATLLAAATQLVVAKPLALPQDPNTSTAISPSATIISASEAPTATAPTPVNPNANPCAQVAQMYNNPNTTSDSTGYGSFVSFTPKVPAKLAWDCLNDVPLDSVSAGPWLDSLRPYIEWQSTTAYLKNPPEGYQEPAADVWGDFESIKSRAASGEFANEYELEFALYRLFQTTHDGHFRYLPKLAGGVFGFGRPISLVSYSIDGTSRPKPYVYSDVLSFFVNGTAEPSAVTQIDGQDALEFLEIWAQYGSLQDPDALYNNVFYELAQVSLGTSGSGAGTFAGAGRGAYIYPGPTTTLQFENGTTAKFDNFARVLTSFRNIQSGADLYKTYVNPKVSVTSSVSVNNNAVATATVSPRPGYPSPVVIQQNNYIAGYYLDEPGYEDIAVLACTSFVGEDDYQDVAYSFIEQASAAGKTKLVIDVSANGGGTILQGYNLFLNLFPDILPYGATRFRSHETFDIIGETASERIWYYPFNYTNPPNPVWQDFGGGTPFTYRSDVDINYENFTSWRDKNPPNEFYGDNFTSIIRWNLSDPLNTPANGVQVNGFGNRTGLPPSRPFTPENIVILYDGYCASTCAIFSELMTEQAGIRTISIGGRSRDGPMQTVGGVKGTNNYPWSFINELVTDTYALAPDQAGFFNSTSLYSYVDPDTSFTPFQRALTESGQVNVRDGIRMGDETQTPLQFVYEPADCRLYYTAEMTVDVTAIWEEVVDVTWNGDSCVDGGFSSSEEYNEKRAEGASVAKLKAERRLKKRKQQMTASRALALAQSQDLFTDLNSIVPRQGLMLP